MHEIVVTARKWGNSVGITLPAETVDAEKIRPNDRLVLNVKKIMPIKNLFGTFKTKKTAQQIKDEMRRGWD